LRFVRWQGFAFVFLACSVSALASERIAVVTLLEGPAALVRGTTRYALAEGVRVRPGDIIEVSEKGLAEIEFFEGTALALGPGARMLSIVASRSKSATGDYYVARGAMKISGVKQGETMRLITPVFTVQPGEGSAVLVLGAADGAVFVEGGAVRITEPAVKGAAPAPAVLKGGEFYARKADQKGALAARPPQSFVAALPRTFLDPLPSRLARYKEREIQPKRLDEVNYAEVEDWLKAPPDIRRPLMPRFRPRLADPAFRSELIANLKHHPEWDPILFPEKYKPKNSAQDSPGSPAVAGTGAAR
jgi:hypothetical protein